jgi:hypothetical protein
MRKAKLLIMGDSVSIRVANQDHDKRNLIDMVTGRLAASAANVSIADFVGSGFNWRHFAAHLEEVHHSSRDSPLLIVAPINIRAFSYQWSWSKKWNLHNLPSERNSAAKFFSEINFFIQERFPRKYINGITISNAGFKRRNRGILDASEKYRSIFYFHYGFMSPSPRAVKDMEVFIKKCERMSNVDLVLYFTPINYKGFLMLQAGDIVEHIDAIKKRINKSVRGISKKTKVFDFSFQVDSGGFFHEFEPTEHLSQVGREYLARELTGKIEFLLR